MQPERRFYNSITATALCEAGAFVLYGYKLRVFSFAHSAQLTQLQCPAYVAKTFTPCDLLHAATVCAGEFILPAPDEAAALIATHDFAEQTKIWSDYIETCSAPPHLKTSEDRVGSLSSAPDEMITAAFLHQHSNLTDEEIWHGCYGKNMWLAATIGEQIAGRSSILSEEELADIAAQSTPEAAALIEKQNALFEKIEMEFSAALAAATTDEEREAANEKRRERLRNFEAEVQL